MGCGVDCCMSACVLRVYACYIGARIGHAGSEMN